MTYEEFLSPDFRERYRAKISFCYDWKIAGLSGGEAKARGFGNKFVLRVTTGDAMAAIRCLLICLEGKNPGDVTDEYIEKHYPSLYISHYDYLPLVFKDEAVKRMKELLSTQNMEAKNDMR